ncbi:hypothetical protein FVB9288_02334 [Flavobacterium sp. CECT 9288]|uniref:NHLP leader peptide family RiPP precursor n=1 Tax=Flavobacterium sp. CECT 9288 TaxID=2845819 RepID=UPI001E508451|nr:NHLP leader peptide family RiPP precursor [Flavobacterium sp. CECT 9288]CAH0336626.1 hypothetical protein FVB9288_02334 [Flavobacterium sp. CECT 9288]
MNISEKQAKFNEYQNKIINLCWTDETFKQELIANPAETLSKLGATIDSNTKIVVNDQSDASVLNINIPPKPDMADIELTEEELEIVAGGQEASIRSYFCDWTINIPITIY